MSELFTLTKTQDQGLFESSDSLELIKPLANGKVDARNLHLFLEIQTRFADWIKRSIDEYNFIENTDFLKIEKPHLNNTIDYELSIPMAKELCMTAKTEYGKKARLYFIEMEKKALVPKQLTTFDLLRSLVDQLETQNRQIEAVRSEIQEVKDNQLQLETISIEAPIQTPRQRLVELVNKIADQFGLMQASVWHKLYHILRYSQVLDGHGVDIPKRAKNACKSKIDVLDELDLCQTGYSILVNHYKVRPHIDFYQD